MGIFDLIADYFRPAGSLSPSLLVSGNKFLSRMLIISSKNKSQEGRGKPTQALHHAIARHSLENLSLQLANGNQTYSVRYCTGKVFTGEAWMRDSGNCPVCACAQTTSHFFVSVRWPRVCGKKLARSVPRRAQACKHLPPAPVWCTVYVTPESAVEIQAQTQNLSSRYSGR